MAAIKPDQDIQLSYEELYESLLDRERARLREQQARRESEILLEGLRVLGSASTAEAGLLGILAILDSSESLDGSLVLTQNDGGQYEILSSSLPSLSPTTWEEHALFRRLFSRKKPAIIHDTSRVQEWRSQPPWIRDAYLSAIHAPFLFGGCRAILTCVHHLPGFFSYRQAKLLSRFTPLITQSLLTIQHLNELQRTQRELRGKSEQLKNALDRVSHMARTDYLTQLQNRRCFYELAEKELRRAVRAENRLSLLMLDIDDFKTFNDEFGHDVGDTVLRTLAETCSPILREHDLFARIGGEEFVVLLPETSPDEAAVVAERLRKAVARGRMAPSLKTGQLTISIGLAEMRPGEKCVDPLLKRADQTLQQAKQGGKNQVASEEPPATEKPAHKRPIRLCPTLFPA